METPCTHLRQLGRARGARHGFEDDGGGRIAKKMAGYHRFHAVRVAVGETLRAAG